MSKPLVVAAIDFGTTFSTCGFSFRHEYESDPTNITAKQWTGLKSAVSLKGPTSILINPDGQTIDSFGFDAEDKYAELVEKGQHNDWYFFKRFKMQLYDKIGIQNDFTVKDASGKCLMAKTVFSLSIRYFKDDLIDMMSEKHIFVGDLTENVIMWVLTVPAIWNDTAKQFMREAAENAGIRHERLIIALEPEAASVYCRLLPTTRNQDSVGQLPSGSKYMILDAGGGTVDITVHETTQTRELKEIYKASGGDWGGTMVDRAFEEFISEILGSDVMRTLKEEEVESYLDVMRNFEVKKRLTKKDTQVTMHIPTFLTNVPEKKRDEYFKNKISEAGYDEENVSIKRDKLKLHSDVIKGFYQRSLDNITDHLTFLFQKPELTDCDILLMVGGYSESPLLQQRIKETFPNMKIVVPSDAGLAVLKGAVIYGHNTSVIAQRVCKYTYGNGYAHEFSPDCDHPPTKTFYANGVKWCADLFFAHVHAGDVIQLGDEREVHQFLPIVPWQTEIYSSIHCTKERDPVLVTSPGCVKLGYITLPIPDTTGGRFRIIDLSFLFGGTEIEVKAKDPRDGTFRKVKVSFWG
ncbi:heat shock 70 kDa protein 12A-like [Ruditapes philippinarum]|uniref:heat shock 70 kDa protein 12A-like n=1 Tax=Ruditapes philippinarum TaxID=129788 RepID=UPI00295C18CB|nr:heat shock 70 kDa protein 12A-like [Ruditapes philippinarum]